MGKKILSLVGGLIALGCLVASLFVGLMGWYNTPAGWVNALGVSNASGTAIADLSFISSPFDIMTILPGALALVGAILCFIPKKITCILGSLLIFGAIAVLIFLGFELDMIWVDATTHIGYGALGTAFGGLLGLIGAFLGSNDF